MIPDGDGLLLMLPILFGFEVLCFTSKTFLKTKIMTLLSLLSLTFTITISDESSPDHNNHHHHYDKQSGKSHECVHDSIEHELSQHIVSYTHHPAEIDQSLANTKNDSLRRKLLASSPYKPIRIRPYYDPLLINPSTLSLDTITYIKSLVSSSIRYLQQFVKVTPVDGPLFVHRCKRTWRYNNFAFTACPLSDYAQPLKCQAATIPDDHVAESWYYDPLSLRSTMYKPAGGGAFGIVF